MMPKSLHHRAGKIAALSPEAKEEAREADIIQPLADAFLYPAERRPHAYSMMA
jgi:hypothetical protein